MKKLFTITVLIATIFLNIHESKGSSVTYGRGKCAILPALLESVACELCRAYCSCLCSDGRWNSDPLFGGCGGGGCYFLYERCSADNTFDFTRFDNQGQAAWLRDIASKCSCMLRLPCDTPPADPDTPNVSGCPWFDNLANQCSNQEIIVNASHENLLQLGIENRQATAETSIIDRGAVPQLEARLGQMEEPSTLRSIGMWGLEDGPRGDFVRIFILDNAGDPYTYDSPRTTDFFNRIDQIQGTSECDKMRQVYETVTSAVPGYGVYEGDPLSHYSTFEQMLIAGAGICREKSALLIAALERQGIDARLVSSPNHAWVRVTLEEGGGSGKEIDLDPTYYQNFVPLKPRVSESDPNYCR